jgi:hypothetical protein
MMEERITRIELSLDQHSKHLNSIQRLLDQIRWMAVGVGGYVLVEQAGGLAALKMLA